MGVDISDARVIDAYADLSTLAKSNGWAIFDDKNDLWIAAATRASTSWVLSERSMAPWTLLTDVVVAFSAAAR